jgi:hypothetical protein
MWFIENMLSFADIEMSIRVWYVGVKAASSSRYYMSQV